MWVKRVVIVAVLIFAVCALASSSRKVEAAPNLTVINSYGYRDTVFGIYWLFGEVQNTGDTAATNIIINASYYDAYNNLINVSSATIPLVSGGLFLNTFVLNPGAKVSFWTALFPTQGSASVDHYDFAISFEESASKAVGLQILSSTVTNYGIGSVNVTGTAKNVGVVAQSGIDVYVAVYDSGGKVVGTTWMAWIDRSVSANEEVSFEFTLLIIPNPYVETVNFGVTAQSPDYVTASAYTGTVIPEFPSLITTMLLMMLTTAVLVFYKKRNI